jgi:membrane-associated protein
VIQTPFIAQVPAAGILSPDGLLQSFGPWAFAAVLAIVFIECGLLIGLVLPGDSLLFITGMFIATKFIDVNLVLAITLISIAAIAGNLLGYWVGVKLGPALFRRPDSRFFKQEYVDRTQEFFDQYGPRALVLARFTPIVRTLITAVAGIAKMNYRTFATYSAVGGVVWVVVMTLLGYYLGTVPFIADNIEVLTIVVVIVSVIPIILELRKGAKRNGNSDSTGTAV